MTRSTATRYLALFLEFETLHLKVSITLYFVEGLAKILWIQFSGHQEVVGKTQLEHALVHLRSSNAFRRWSTTAPPFLTGLIMHLTQVHDFPSDPSETTFESKHLGAPQKLVS